jgi:hypothetical protein
VSRTCDLPPLEAAAEAVEGRNGYLSQMPHYQCGLSKQRYKVTCPVLSRYPGFVRML